MGTPKYLQIRDAILSEIRSGRLAVGARLPNREDLIRQFGVSRTTLAKALELLIESGTLRSTRKAGTFVACAGTPKRLTVVSHAPIATRASAKSSAAEMTSLFQAMLRPPPGVSLQFTVLNSRARSMPATEHTDGSIWITPPDTWLDRLRGRRDVLVVNRYGEGLNAVSTDHRGAMREATAHFLKTLPRAGRCFFLDRPGNEFVIRERREGFLEACADAGRFYRIVETPTPFEETVGALRSIPVEPRSPTLLVSPSHILTGAVLFLARERGWRLNDDFFYVDFDNEFSLEESGFAIPSVLQDYRRMGEAALEAAQRLGAEPIQEFIPHVLRV